MMGVGRVKVTGFMEGERQSARVRGHLSHQEKRHRGGGRRRRCNERKDEGHS
jgi:hypothetical protein